MHTQQLGKNIPEQSHEIERSQEAAIAAEIAERILEYGETFSRPRAMSFLQKIVTMHALNKDAPWIFLSLMTGDLSAITDSYSAQGAKLALDKQAVQQRMERALRIMQVHYPACATAIVQLRHITANISTVESNTNHDH